jgi:outer membrane receptor protein involved in Fe transport
LLALPLHALGVDLDKEIAFHIPAQDLAAALIDFSRQTRLQVIVSDDLTGQTARSVDGRITIKRALSQLLGPAGLQYRVAGETSIAVGKTLKAADEPSGASRSGYESSFIRLAQVSETDGDARGPANNFAGPDASPNGADAEQVTVIGSRIRGHENPASQVYTVTSEDIRKQGFTSMDDIFRSLPQVSGRGLTAAMDLNDQVPGGSMGHSSIDLGGFGAKSTLVLINGRRTANSSIMFGDSVNVNVIPVSVIERIEVLPTAAAAIYGADAVGGVVNITLKKRTEFETNTRMGHEKSSTGGDGSSLSQDLSFGWGSGRFTGVVSYRHSDPVTAKGVGFTTQDFRSRGGYDLRGVMFGETGIVAGLGSLPADHDGTSFTPGDVSTANTVRASSIQEYVSPELTTRSAYINAEQDVAGKITLFVDALYSKNDTDNYEIPLSLNPVTVPASNAFNPYGTPVTVSYLFDTERDAGRMPSTYREGDQELIQGTFGAVLSLPGDWQLQVYGTRAEESSFHTFSRITSADPRVVAALADSNPQTALNLFGDGTVQNQATLDSIVSYWLGKRHNELSSNLTAYSVQADGTLFDLPAGAIKGSFVAERRKDTFDWTGFTGNQPKGDRTADSLGAELAVPLPSSFELSLAARWDRYNAEGDFDYDGVQDKMDEFSDVSPMVGLSWRPIAGLRLRASWNKAFRAPVVHDLAGLPAASIVTIFDPLAPGGPALVSVPVTYPSSTNLGPEQAEIWSAGADWESLDATGAGFKASLTYNDTDFTDRINGAYVYFYEDSALVLSHPEIFSGTAQRDTDGNLTAVSLRNMNIAELRSRIWNMDLSYGWRTGGGHFFSIGAAGVYTVKFAERIDDSLPETERRGTYDGPDRLRATLRAGWSSPAGNWNASLMVRTSSSYSNTIRSYYINDPPAGLGASVTQQVAGYTTVDVSTSYRFASDSAWFEGVGLTAGVRNLFDEDFPFINLVDGRVMPFDPRRVDVRGRVGFLEVNKRFR